MYIYILCLVCGDICVLNKISNSAQEVFMIGPKDPLEEYYSGSGVSNSSAVFHHTRKLLTSYDTKQRQNTMS